MIGSVIMDLYFEAYMAAQLCSGPSGTTVLYSSFSSQMISSKRQGRADCWNLEVSFFTNLCYKEKKLNLELY
jgi:hypothetical protein